MLTSSLASLATPAGSSAARRSPNDPRVVVLGGGYAGVELVESLEDVRVSVTLVDRKPDHTRKTKLWKVAVGKDETATESLKRLTEKNGAQLKLGEVQEIDTASRQVKMQGGDSVAYDYLVVALGSRPNLMGHSEWARDVMTMDQPEDALRIRETVRGHALAALQLADPAARAERLRFLVIGGGATGVELAGVAHEVVAQVSPSLLKDLDICLVHSGPSLLNGLPENASRAATARLEKKGMRFKLGHRVTEVQPGQVQLSSGETLKASAILWATGTRAPELLENLGKTDRAGRLEVTEHLTLPDHPEVFIVGDAALARCQGQPVPANKRAAVQEAELAARNIQNAISGRPMEPFRFHEKSLSHIGPVDLD